LGGLRFAALLIGFPVPAVEFEHVLADERLFIPVEELGGRVDLVVMLAVREDGDLVQVFGDPRRGLGDVDKAVLDDRGLGVQAVAQGSRFRRVPAVNRVIGECSKLRRGKAVSILRGTDLHLPNLELFGPASVAGSGRRSGRCRSPPGTKGSNPAPPAARQSLAGIRPSRSRSRGFPRVREPRRAPARIQRADQASWNSR
jgi:hypothetical protein